MTAIKIATLNGNSVLANEREIPKDYMIKITFF